MKENSNVRHANTHTHTSRYNYKDSQPIYILYNHVFKRIIAVLTPF